MNRQILFRGRKGNIWYFGDLQHDQHGNMFIAFHDNIEHVRRVKPVEPETVGQFTGLTDKNGKQIFEGDILERKYRERKNSGDEVDYWHRAIVHFGKWSEDCDFNVSAYCWLLGSRPLEEDEDLKGVCRWRKIKIVGGQLECVVIGNIFDNMDFVDIGKANKGA